MRNIEFRISNFEAKNILNSNFQILNSVIGRSI
jgi:hypothetical protein